MAGRIAAVPSATKGAEKTPEDVVVDSVRSEDALRFWQSFGADIDWLKPHVEGLSAEKLRFDKRVTAAVDQNNPIWLEAPLRRLQMQMQPAAGTRAPKARADARAREEAVFREITRILHTWDASTLKDPEQFVVSLRQVLKHAAGVHASAKVGGMSLLVHVLKEARVSMDAANLLLSTWAFVLFEFEETAARLRPLQMLADELRSEGFALFLKTALAFVNDCFPTRRVEGFNLYLLGEIDGPLLRAFMASLEKYDPQGSIHRYLTKTLSPIADRASVLVDSSADKEGFEDLLAGMAACRRLLDVPRLDGGVKGKVVAFLADNQAAAAALVATGGFLGLVDERGVYCEPGQATFCKHGLPSWISCARDPARRRPIGAPAPNGGHPPPCPPAVSGSNPGVQGSPGLALPGGGNSSSSSSGGVSPALPLPNAVGGVQHAGPNGAGQVPVPPAAGTATGAHPPPPPLQPNTGLQAPAGGVGSSGSSSNSSGSSAVLAASGPPVPPPLPTTGLQAPAGGVGGGSSSSSSFVQAMQTWATPAPAPPVPQAGVTSSQAPAGFGGSSSSSSSSAMQGGPIGAPGPPVPPPLPKPGAAGAAAPPNAPSLPADRMLLRLARGRQPRMFPSQDFSAKRLLRCVASVCRALRGYDPKNPRFRGDFQPWRLQGYVIPAATHGLWKTIKQAHLAGLESHLEGVLREIKTIAEMPESDLDTKLLTLVYMIKDLDDTPCGDDAGVPEQNVAKLRWLVDSIYVLYRHLHGSEALQGEGALYKVRRLTKLFADIGIDPRRRLAVWETMMNFRKKFDERSRGTAEVQARLFSVMQEDSIKQLVSAALMHARQLSGSAQVDTNRLAACRSLCKHFALLRAMVDNLCKNYRGVLVLEDAARLLPSLLSINARMKNVDGELLGLLAPVDLELQSESWHRLVRKQSSTFRLPAPLRSPQPPCTSEQRLSPGVASMPSSQQGPERENSPPLGSPQPPCTSEQRLSPGVASSQQGPEPESSPPPGSQPPSATNTQPTHGLHGPETKACGTHPQPDSPPTQHVDCGADLKISDSQPTQHVDCGADLQISDSEPTQHVDCGADLQISDSPPPQQNPGTKNTSPPGTQQQEPGAPQFPPDAATFDTASQPPGFSSTTAETETSSGLRSRDPAPTAPTCHEPETKLFSVNDRQFALRVDRLPPGSLLEAFAFTTLSVDVDANESVVLDPDCVDAMSFAHVAEIVNYGSLPTGLATCEWNKLKQTLNYLNAHEILDFLVEYDYIYFDKLTNFAAGAHADVAAVSPVAEEATDTLEVLTLLLKSVTRIYEHIDTRHVTTFFRQADL